MSEWYRVGVGEAIEINGFFGFRVKYSSDEPSVCVWGETRKDLCDLLHGLANDLHEAAELLSKLPV